MTVENAEAGLPPSTGPNGTESEPDGLPTATASPATDSSNSASPQQLGFPWPFLSVVVLSVVLAGIVIMTEAARLLSAVRLGDESAASIADLQAFKIWPDREKLEDAFELWGTVPGANAYVQWHAAADTLTFAPFVAVLCWLFLAFITKRPHISARINWIAPAIYLVLDEAENIMYWFAGNSPSPATICVLSGLTAVKWWALISVAVVAFIGAPRSMPLRNGTSQLGRALWSLRVQLGAVVILAVLVALPGEGPLDQLPDIIRASFIKPELRTLLVSAGVGSALCWAIWLTGFALLHTDRKREAEGAEKKGISREGTAKIDAVRKPNSSSLVRRLPFWIVVDVILFVISAILLLDPKDQFRSRFSLAILAGPIVVAVLILLALVSRRSDTNKAENALVGGGLGNEAAGAIETSFHLHHRLCVARAEQEKNFRSQPLISALAVLTVLPITIFGIGALRAVMSLAMVPNETSEQLYLWLLAGVCLLGAAVLVIPLQRFTIKRYQRRTDADAVIGEERCPVRRSLWMWAALAAAVAMLFALNPTAIGTALGPSDVIVVSAFVVVILFGSAAYLSERYAPPRGFRRLGMRRAPTSAVIVAIFLVAGGLDDEVSYHLADVSPAAEPASSVQEDLRTAVDRWYEVAKACKASNTDAGVPMVLVAAPGGGIRAAYWTVRGLQILADSSVPANSVVEPRTDDPCFGSSIFLASGVSGGSIGLTQWEAAPARAAELIKNVSAPTPLAVDLAGYLFRDAPRSLVGLQNSGLDRSAVFESALNKAAQNTLSVDFFRGLRTGHTGGGDGKWRPLLVLNSTDLATGCKILISHVKSLASSPERDCRANLKDGTPTPIVPHAWDAADFLAPRDCDQGGAKTCCANSGSLSAVTAAHLSARFPVISPTGALRRCDADESFHYLFAADGGYLENSGVQTLSQIYTALGPIIASKNRSLSVGPEPCACIRPYVIVLENDVQAADLPPQTKRIREYPAAAGGKSISQVTTEASLIAELDAKMNRDEYESHRVFLWSPGSTPSVSAPLGWTLSDATRTSLTRGMKSLCADEKASAPLDKLTDAKVDERCRALG